MHPFNADKRGRSRAARSGRVMLSRPSSLQGPSDIPPPVARFLPVSSDLRRAYRRRRTAEMVGLQVQDSVLCLRMPMALPRVPDRCARPFASLPALAFPINVKGRRVSRLLGFIPSPDSLSNDRPGLPDEAAPFALCYGLRIWLAPRAEYDSRQQSTVAFAVPCRGKFSRPVTRATRPQPTHPKRAIGVAISFQIARLRS
jgi:hypothetical protein